MEAESRIRSLESSILYLQEQHAATLRGLHQEMSRLQTKCSELSFRLSMASTTSAAPDDHDNAAPPASTAGISRPAKLAPLERARGNREDELRRALASRDKEAAELRAKVDALSAKYDASERRNLAYEAELDQLRAFQAAATAAISAAATAESSSPSPPPPPSTADGAGSSSLNSSGGPVFIRRLPLPAKAGSHQQQPQQQNPLPSNLVLQASAMIPTAAPAHLRALSGGAGFKGSGAVLPPISRRNRLPQLHNPHHQPHNQQQQQKQSGAVRVSDRKETEVIERIDLMGNSGAVGASGGAEGNGAGAGASEQPSSSQSTH